MSSTILVIHGPNLNLLGKREPEVYGDLTLQDINQQLISQAQNSSIQLETFQSNWEGAIVDRIHESSDDDPGQPRMGLRRLEIEIDEDVGASARGIVRTKTHAGHQRGIVGIGHRPRASPRVSAFPFSIATASATPTCN